MHRTHARALSGLLLFTQLARGAETEGLRARFGPSFATLKTAQAAAQGRTLLVPRLAAAPVVDGSIQDPAWTDAASISEFTDNSPPTRAWVGFDEHALYVAVRCENRPGQDAVGELRPRDLKTWLDDCVHLLIMPADESPLYRFIVGSKNAIADTKGSKQDYDPEWRHATGATATAWVLEAVIPWAAVGLDGPAAELGFNVSREGPNISQRSWGRTFHSAAENTLALEGIEAAAPATNTKTQMSSALVAVSGSALQCALDRTFARPGERWIRMVLTLRPKDTLGRAALHAAVSAPGATVPAAQRTFAPTHERCVLEIDLRRLGLTQGRLTVQLLENGTATGTVEALLSARAAPRVFAPGDRIPILVDLPEIAPPPGAWPIHAGVPFGPGELWTAEDLCIVDESGTPVPCQHEVTGRWAEEGSIQWVRFDALVDPARSCYVTRRPGTPETAEPRLTLRENDTELIIDTGAARYVLGTGASPVREIRVDGRRLAAVDGRRGLYVIDQRHRVASASADGETVQVEARGPVAACVRFEGPYRTADGEELARHVTRVECFAGQRFAKVTHTLILTRDTNEVWFREIGWELRVAPGTAPRALFGRAQGTDAETHTLPLRGASASAFMLQDSHYRFGHGSNHFAIVAEVDGKQPETGAEGEECGDWAALVGSDGGLMANCRDAARQHPKEFLVSGDRLTLKLFSPRAGEELDFRIETLMKMWDVETWFQSVRYRPKYSLEELNKRLRAYRSNAIGWAKTHDLLLAPLPARADTAAAATRLSSLQRDPVLVQAAPEWIYRTRAMGRVHPSDPERFPALEQRAREGFAHYIGQDNDWGHFGFIYYGVGPNISYAANSAYPPMWRYQLTTYTYRKGVWRQWVRSQDRTLRQWAEKLTRTEADAAHAHVAAGNLTRGLLRRSAWPELPIYWGERAEMQHGSATDLHRFVWHYQLCGDRRLRDFVEEWAAGVKDHWTPVVAAGSWRILMAFRQIAQAYSFTFDPDLRDLAAATADIFADPDGALLLTKERPYHSTTYKTQVDVRGIVDAWEIFGAERYRAMARRIADFWWPRQLKCPPTGYNVPLAFLASFLYDETRDPAYAQVTERFVRHIGATPLARYTNGCAAMAPLSDAGIALDLLTRTGADKRPVGSWFHFSDPVHRATLVVHKDDRREVNFHYTSPGRLAFRALNPANNWGLDTMCDAAMLHGAAHGKARLPKDVNECDVELAFSQPGEHAVYADGVHRLVLYAPGLWYPAPTEEPRTRYYFQVPADAAAPRIFFEGSARLFAPGGIPHANGEALGKWVTLPTDTPGLWAFEPVENKLVRVHGLPPFFAAGDPGSFYLPDIQWTVEPLPEATEPLAPDAVYVPGALGTADNRGLHLTGKRHLYIEAQGEHPSGNGSLYLPHKEGTIEFWFRPSWNSGEIDDGSRFLIMGRMYPPKGKASYLQLQYVKEGQKKDLYALAYTDGQSGPRSERLSRHDTYFEAGEWVHVALVWGRRDDIELYPTQRKWDDVFVLSVYVNGRKGRCSERHMNRGNDPIAPLRQLLIGYFRPERNLDGVVDELRISDVQRYLTDFQPPSRDVEFEVDEHTRALFHFNGDLTCVSFGEKAPVKVEIKQ